MFFNWKAVSLILQYDILEKLVTSVSKIYCIFFNKNGWTRRLIQVILSFIPQYNNALYYLLNQNRPVVDNFFLAILCIQNVIFCKSSLLDCLLQSLTFAFTYTHPLTPSNHSIFADADEILKHTDANYIALKIVGSKKMFLQGKF